MREGWAIKPIGEIADACLGKMLDKNKNKGTPKPYLRNLNVRWFDFDLSDVLEMRFEDDERERYTARKGDLLICEGGYPGRAAIWEDEEPIYFQKAIHRVRFHDPERTKWFLYYLHLCDIDGSLRSHFTGAGIQHFTGEALKRFRVPLPPLSEQQRIVAILDEAFAGLATASANAEKNLKNARELFESHLNSVFETENEGWRTRPLESLCENDRIITYGVIKLGKEISDGVPCLRTSNVRWLRIDTDGIKRISPALSNEYRRTILRGGEVLVNVRGTLGGVAVAAQDMKDWNVSREVAVVPVDIERVDPAYLAYFIATRRSQNWLTDVQKGLAYVGINIADLRTLPISFPDRSTQIQLIAQFEKLSGESRRLEAVYTERRSQIDDLRQAILRAAFSGELTSPPTQAIKEAAE